VSANIKKNITISVFVSLNLGMVVLACIFLAHLEPIYKVVAVVLLLILTLSIPSVQKQEIHKICLVASVIAAIALIAYIVLNETGAIYVFRDFSIIKNFILGTRQWGILVFMMLVILQAAIIPVPMLVTILAGVAIYGSFWTFIMVSAGVIIGSIISFYIGRSFGKRLAIWMFGEQKVEKYSHYVGKKHKGMFVVVLLFPFFPDDMICLLAGVSDMSFKFFFFTLIFTRPVMIGVTSFLGSGQIIPFRGWGIPVWIGLIALVIASFIIINIIQRKREKKKASQLSEANQNINSSH